MNLLLEHSVRPTRDAVLPQTWCLVGSTTPHHPWPSSLHHHRKHHGLQSNLDEGGDLSPSADSLQRSWIGDWSLLAGANLPKDLKVQCERCHGFR